MLGMFNNKQQKEQKLLNDEIVIPQSDELEKAFLGAILLDDKSIHQAIEMVEVEDLFHASHRRIYKAMIALSEKNRAIDPVLLAEQLQTESLLEAVGGIAYLADLFTYAIPQHMKSYAFEIIRFAQQRRLLNAGQEIISTTIANDGTSSTELLQNARKVIDAVGTRIESAGFTDICSLAFDELNKMERLSESRELSGIATGFDELDRLLCGFQKDELIVLAARPGVGKTSLALRFAIAAAISGNKVGFFSLEMSKSQLVNRLLCASARIDSHRARHGFLGKSDWASLNSAQQQFAGLKIMIDDTTFLTITAMRAKARRLKAEHGLDILFVDYLQLMKPSEKKQNREQEVAEISRGLKALSKELNIPIVALSQLSRGVDNRSDHRPQLQDLRESGSLEQDSDVVMFIYREEIYHPTEENKNIAELIISKQRNGPTDTVRMLFQKQFTSFEPLWQEV